MIPTQPFTSDQIGQYYESAVDLLKRLIETPSLSKEEYKTGDLLQEALESFCIDVERKGNNVWARNKYFDPSKPTILLNSHHDTVKPNNGYTHDPFHPIEKEGKLFGLGSNDAGGALVSLLHLFKHFFDREDLPYNIIFAGTAEEENSGRDGVESVLEDFGAVDFAIVGEPTEMKMAVAEKGLMVLDCYVHGQSGHAARDKGENAIYKAMPMLHWFETYQFSKFSDHLGDIRMSVTMIESGYQHNVIPDVCHFVVDVRTTDAYSNEEVLAIIQDHVSCEIKPRSTRLNPSSLPESHSVYQVARELGIDQFGSPTTSDQAVMNFPTFKMGPGMSERSHTADEFIYLNEIKEGIELYITLLEALFSSK